MKDKILILDDLDGKKKLGAVKAVAELRNRKNNIEGNWKASIDSKNIILNGTEYNEDKIYKIPITFFSEKNIKILEQLSNLTPDISVFRDKCIFNNKINSENTDVLSPRDLLNKIIDIGKQSLSIQRFKGLGEMNPEELWETTLNKENNSLLKVTYSKELDDQTTAPTNDDNEIFFTLMGEDVSKRKNFIDKNALKVSNLDV